jgi:hypothetical protein
MSWDNPHIRALLQGVRKIGVTVTESWAALERVRFHSDEQWAEETKRRMADKMAHTIVSDLLAGGRWTQRNEPHGATITFDGYFLTYDELVRLMREAYDLGRTEPVARNLIVGETLALKKATP